MSRIELRDGGLWIDDRRLPVRSGEVHYWRVNPAHWDTILEACREVGVTMIATYVPWEFHELAPGRFDLVGETQPQRNLVGFLERLKSHGLSGFIRPGPYIYAEWRNAGVPERVVTLPRLGPDYQEEARVWMRAVVAAIRPFFATQHDGPLVLFQPDNEIDLFSHWFERECGLDGTADGLFQQFLRETYADLATLNAAWGSRYRSFEAATPLAVATDRYDPHVRNRVRDYWRFQHWAVASILCWHVSEYRSLGVDLPMIANFYPGGDVQNWSRIAGEVDGLGIDWYPRNCFRAGTHGSADGEHRRFLDSCRWVRALSRMAMIAELEAGVWHGWHEHTGLLTADHYRLLLGSALLAGIHAFNWYMLVERDNWYFSPIDATGRPRADVAPTVRALHTALSEDDISSMTKVTDLAVALTCEQIATDDLLRDNPVLDALYAADLDYEIWDLDSDRFRKPVVLYGGADWLAERQQQALVDYVRGGGHLIVFVRYPHRDERQQPCNRLDVRSPDRVLSPLGKRVAVELGTLRAEVDGALAEWDAPPGEPLWCEQTIGRQQAVENADAWMRQAVGTRRICGYRESQGRGTLTVVGLSPNAALVDALARWLGAPPASQATNPGVKTALFADGTRRVLVAVNTLQNALECTVRLTEAPIVARGVDADTRLPASTTVRLAAFGGNWWQISA